MANYVSISASLKVVKSGELGLVYDFMIVVSLIVEYEYSISIKPLSSV